MGCLWYGFNSYFFGYTSIGMLMLISVDRYISLIRRDIGRLIFIGIKSSS